MSSYRLYIGTHTDETQSKGIYHLTFDADKKSVSVQNAAFLRNPSYLSILDQTLYACSERKDSASAAAYHIGDGNSPLTLTAEKELDGELFCHLYSARITGTVFASCFLSGNLLILDPKGLNVLSELRMSSNGEEKPWTHCGICSEDGKILAATDMGRSRIYLCPLADGIIDASQPPSIYEGVARSGPRHLVFHPKLDMLYVANELNSTVDVFSLERGGNSLKHEQNFPAGNAREGIVNYPSSIVITNDGRYVLVANRGLDTVSVFAVSLGGLMEKAGEYSCYGQWPRHMMLTSDMRYIVFSNQHSNSVVICPFDPSDGSIDSPVCNADIPSPTCAAEV